MKKRTGEEYLSPKKRKRKRKKKSPAKFSVESQW